MDKISPPRVAQYARIKSTATLEFQGIVVMGSFSNDIQDYKCNITENEDWVDFIIFLRMLLGL